MSEQQDVEARVERDVAEARARLASVEDGPKRWNRMEEAMEAVCEEAVSLLDQIGRYEQADEIQSHMAAHERFDLLCAILREDAQRLATEADEAGLSQDLQYCQRIFPVLDGLAEGVRRHRPGA